MESVAKAMIDLLIKECRNEDIKKGLKIALNVIECSGYYNMNDWEEMSDEEKLEEVKDCLEY